MPMVASPPTPTRAVFHTHNLHYLLHEHTTRIVRDGANAACFAAAVNTALVGVGGDATIGTL